MPKFSPKLSLATQVFFGFWIGFFTLFWAKAVGLGVSGAFEARHINIWGDWAVHFTMANAMATRGFFLSTSPFLLGAKFSYPFVADLISAVLIRLTGDLIYSFLVPSLILSIFFVWVIFYFFKTLWGSEKKAILSSLVFLLNGGLGFYYYFRDNLPQKSFWELLATPLHEVTRYDTYNIKWISIVDSMMIPQRAFLLGFPLTVLALTFIYQYFFQNQLRQKKKLIVASIILGLMPIIHTHSFLAAFIILACWSLEDTFNHLTGSWRKGIKWPIYRIKAWVIVAAATAIVSIPIIGKYFLGQIGHGFTKFYPGWLANSFHMNWFEFWWRNWFLTPWLALIGFLLLAKNSPKKVLTFFPFVFIFALANLFLFQPFDWDNTKLIVWASLGFAYLVIFALDKARNNIGLLPKKHWLKTLIVSLIFLLTILSGALDLHYISRHELHTYDMYSREEWELASWIKENTPKDAIWLTGNQHNHLVFNLTGRQSIITYEGTMWTHGYDYTQEIQDVRNFYQSPAKYPNVLKKYRVRYIIIGANERSSLKAKDEEFIKLFPLIKETRTYKIFESQYN